MRRSASRIASVLLGCLPLALSILFACAKDTPRPLEFETGSRAEVTLDGLMRVRNARYRDVWVKPDADFAGYTEVQISPVRVSYKRKPRSTHYAGTGSNFALTDTQMRRLTEEFRAEFERAVQESLHYGLVEKPGPGTLRLEVSIIDLQINVPTERRGSERVYTTSTGRMTLLLEIYDALSGEILARAADAREARAPGHSGIGDLYWSNAATDRDAMRRVFRRWARILRERLDAIHEIRPSRPLEEDEATPTT